MSTKRTIDIDINTNADQAAKQFETLATGVNKAADSANNLDAKFEDVFQGIEPLTTRLGEAEDRLYELALAGDTTSKEYQELLTKVGQYRKVQIQTDLAVDQAAQTLSQKLGTALQGASSGFLAIQGIIGLTGTESEKLNETLLKVQSAMAFQQGISGLQEFSKQTGLAGKAMRIFNLIVSGNPFAIFATVLGAVIAGVVLFTDTLQPAIDAIKKFTDFIGLTDFAETKLAENRKQRHEEEMKRQKEEAEARKKAESELKALITSEEELLEAQGRSQQARNIKRRRLQEEANQALIDGDVATFNKIQVALIAIDKQEEQIYKDRVKRRLDAARQIEDLELQLLEDGLQKELKINEVKFRRLREDALSNQDLTESERLKKIELFGDLEKQARLKIIDDNVDQATDAQLKEIGLLDEFGQMKIERLQLQAKGEVDVEKQKNLEILQDNRKTNAQIKEDNIATLQSRLELTKEVLGSIGGLATALAKDNEKSAKKAFRINKAVSIGQAIISTAQGIIGQLAVPQDQLSATNFIKAGIVAATGAAQIATISKTKFQGGGGADIQSPQSGGAAQAPQFNVVGDSGVNQLAQLQQQPTQAFVVSGEVTTAQALDRNRVQNATL